MRPRTILPDSRRQARDDSKLALMSPQSFYTSSGTQLLTHSDARRRPPVSANWAKDTPPACNASSCDNRCPKSVECKNNEQAHSGTINFCEGVEPWKLAAYSPTRYQKTHVAAPSHKTAMSPADKIQVRSATLPLHATINTPFEPR